MNRSQLPPGGDNVIPFPAAGPPFGRSAGARAVEDVLPMLADVPSTVCLTGESGAGKGFVARRLHLLGRNAAKPFLAVNCGGMTESLLETELFGHERGAFTGAVATKAGAFEAAGEGTLFLDEIGELTPQAQVKLLHVIDEKRFRRVGSTHTIEVKARLVCATHRDLRAMVAVGTFREDLYYRVSVYPLFIPPLRERAEDLPDIALHLLDDIARSHGHPARGFSREALDILRAQTWPGNVRELKNAIEAAVIRSRGGRIESAHLEARPSSAPAASDDDARLVMPIGELHRRAAEAALRLSNGNRTRAALLLDVDRQTLYKWAPLRRG